MLHLELEMRYAAFATDYDGTLATQGKVPAATLASLKTLARSGRRLLLVTGRELGDLHCVFPELAIFDRVIAENGAIVHEPGRGESTVLAAAPSRELLARLRAHGVFPLSVGRCVVATLERWHAEVEAAIREEGSGHQMIFNKGSLMILPAGVDKGSGLNAALRELGIPAHATVGIGDAENDRALFQVCGLGVAVANALPSVKSAADLVTVASGPAGVCELIDCILKGEDSCQKREL